MRCTVLAAVAALAACHSSADAPLLTAPFTDDFARDAPGPNYEITGPGFAVVNGVLSAHGVHNHPMWLRKKLPHDVRVEFDCWSTEKRGDIKIEIFGDGHSYDPDGGRYTATGYEVIFGGWYNAKSIIARLDEHGKDMVERVQPKVVPNQHYHWKVERVGHKLTWFISPTASPSGDAAGQGEAPTSVDMTTPFLVYDDPQPLEGDDHSYVAFNNWETDTWFDNLVVTPL